MYGKVQKQKAYFSVRECSKPQIKGAEYTTYELGFENTSRVFLVTGTRVGHSVFRTMPFRDFII